MILYVLEEFDHYLLSGLENGNEKADFIPVCSFGRRISGVEELYLRCFIRDRI